MRFQHLRHFIGMGPIVTPLESPKPFNPLAHPLGTPENLGGRELVWRFDWGDITSDAGALLLKKLEEKTTIVRMRFQLMRQRFAACFEDYRSPNQIEHPLLDLLGQRVFGLALGYEDLNDRDELRSDPAAHEFKAHLLAVALSKEAVKGRQRRREHDRGKALAGKSTLNRNALSTLAPLDATHDKLYGQQEGRFFHGYYDDYRYLPL